MLMTRLVVGIFSVGLMVLGAGVVSAQDYPNKPIRIVTGGAGGGNDFEARIIAQGLSGPLDQQVIVDNRSTGIIAAEVVSKAPPDGYTLFVNDAGVWIFSLLQNTSYDLIRDFSPISLIAVVPTILVVHPSVPVKSVKELIALAKAKPGALNYGSSKVGGPSHLGPALFKATTGVNMVRISYKNAGQALNDLIGGHVQLFFGTPAAAGPHVKSGRLRAVAITSAQPSALFPDLPTVAATVPGYENVSIDYLLAPAKTPAAIISRLNQEIVRLLNQADVKEKFLNVAVEVAPSSPEQLAATLKSDIAKWSKLIKDAGIKAE